MTTRFTLGLLLLTVISISCKKEKDEKIDPVIEANHIQYFGFTLIDTYWDDPQDNDNTTNYADEVHSFSNIADILVVAPTDDIIQRMTVMSNLDMQSVLHIGELFFEYVGTDAQSGAAYDLRADYQARWNAFVNTNDLTNNEAMVNAFYIGEEPTWNGISFQELNSATAYVKSQFPNIPILIIEAYPSLTDLIVPETVDWIGFDHYFIKDPNTNLEFQSEWDLLKSKRTTASQKLVVIMDCHYIEWAHGDFGNIELDEMKDVANNYYFLAQADTSVVAILGYFWPNGFDVPEAIGGRGMPQNVKDAYIRIGKEITGKE